MLCTKSLSVYLFTVSNFPLFYAMFVSYPSQTERSSLDYMKPLILLFVVINVCLRP